MNFLIQRPGTLTAKLGSSRSRSRCKKLHTKSNRSATRRCGPLTTPNKLLLEATQTTRAIVDRALVPWCSSNTTLATREANRLKFTQGNRATTRRSKTLVPLHRAMITTTTAWMDIKRAHLHKHPTTIRNRPRLLAMISLSTIEETVRVSEEHCFDWIKEGD